MCIYIYIYHAFIYNVLVVYISQLAAASRPKCAERRPFLVFEQQHMFRVFAQDILGVRARHAGCSNNIFRVSANVIEEKYIMHIYTCLVYIYVYIYIYMIIRNRYIYVYVSYFKICVYIYIYIYIYILFYIYCSSGIYFSI